jgi:hypothetical protein
MIFDTIMEMKEGILRSVQKKLIADISNYDTNLEILLTKSVGIGEHSDITSEVEQWIKKIGEAKEAVSVIDEKLNSE